MLRWYSGWESNPDQRFRKPTFYPLNYQSFGFGWCKDKHKKPFHQESSILFRSFLAFPPRLNPRLSRPQDDRNHLRRRAPPLSSPTRKQGSKRSHTDTQTDAEIVDLQVVALAEFIDHTLLLGREVGKELTLNTFPLCLCQLLVVCQPIASTSSSAQVISPAPLSRIRWLQPSL